MNTVWGWIGLIVLILNYAILLKTNKWFFYVGVLGCVFYIIHSTIAEDYSVLFVNLFLLTVSLVKIKRNQNI